MRKFMINVNGKSYEVEVEEIGGNATSYVAPVVASTPAVANPAPVASANVTSKATAPAGANTISAPLPGTILDVKVNVGDSVKKGQILCILEAMKMENEIVAPNDGKVVAVIATKGTSVNTGDALISLS